jgi:hypothetical protein
MSSETSLARLLRWRLAQAMEDAPPAPSAARLLSGERPWWETWPQRFQAGVDRLAAMQLSFGYAADRSIVHAAHPIPTLILRAEDVETAARVLYLSVRDDRLRLRFQLDAVPALLEPTYEVTFVSDTNGRPELSTLAELSVESEYRLDASLPPGVARAWQTLRANDRMPFLFILRPTPQVV